MRLACRRSTGRHSRHNHINDILQRAFNSAGVLSTREPLGLCTQGKRPDGITSVPWHKGRCLAWDATCPDTFAQSHVQSSSVSAGAAAAAAELKKRNKYSDMPPHIDFTPVAIDTSGVWGEDARDLIKELGRRIALVQLEPRSTSFLRQRISLAIQRGNSFCIQARDKQYEVIFFVIPIVGRCCLAYIVVISSVDCVIEYLNFYFNLMFI